MKTCPTMKPGYPDREAADRAAIVASKRTGVKLATYDCPECRQWHLTRSVGGHNEAVRGRRQRDPR